MNRKIISCFGYQPRHRGLVRLFGGLIAVVALAASATLMIFTWARLNPPVKAGSSSPGAVLLVFSPEQPASQYHLMQASLGAAGISSTCESVEDVTDPLHLKAAIEKLSATAGCTSDQVWLAAAGNNVPVVFQAGSQVVCAGQIMLAPHGLDSLTSGLMRQWPDGRAVAIFAVPSATDPRAQAARAFYERLTGEDTLLFPGFQAKGLFQPEQYLASTGLAWLNVYPALTASTALVSGQLLADVVDWLADWPAAGSGINRLAARTALVDLSSWLLLAGFLLLIVPLGLILLLDVQQPAGLSARTTQRFAWLANSLLWLPALGLAAAIGLLVAWLAGRPEIFLLAGMAVLPGCRGWLLLPFLLIQRNRRAFAADAGEHAGVRRPADTRTWSGILAGLMACLFVLLLAGFWAWLTFGSIVPPAWPWLVLPLLLAFNWSAGLAGTTGRNGRAGEQVLWSTGKLDGVWQHLPFLLLPVAATLILGWSGFLAALLLLVVHLWSVSLGKAGAVLTGKVWIGSLLQTTGFALGFLLPPIAEGLQLFH